MHLAGRPTWTATVTLAASAPFHSVWTRTKITETGETEAALTNVGGERQYCLVILNVPLSLPCV